MEAFLIFVVLVLWKEMKVSLFKNWKRKESKKKMMKLWIIFVLKEKEHENKEDRMKTVNEMVFEKVDKKIDFALEKRKI